jgi:hypothetical protein
MKELVVSFTIKAFAKDNSQGSKVGLLAIATKSDHRSEVGMETNLKGESLLFLA